MNARQTQLVDLFNVLAGKPNLALNTGSSEFFTTSKSKLPLWNVTNFGRKGKFTAEGLKSFRNQILDEIGKINLIQNDPASSEFINQIWDMNSPLGKVLTKLEYAQKVGKPSKKQIEETISFTPKEGSQEGSQEKSEEESQEDAQEPSQEPKVEVIEEKLDEKPKKTNSIKTAKEMVGVLSNRVNNVGDAVDELADAGQQIAQGQQQIAQAGHALVAKLSEPKKKKIDELFLEAEASGKPFDEFLNDIDKSEYDIPLFDKPSLLKKRFEEYQFSKQMSMLSKYGSIPDELLQQMVDSGEMNSDQLLRIQDAKNKIQEIRRREAAKDYVRLEFPSARRERKIKLIDHGINPALLKRP